MIRMGKRTRTILTAVFFIAVYYAVSLAFQWLYLLWQNLFNDSALSQISKNTSDRLYIMNMIVVVVTLFIYAKIGALRSEPLGKVIGIKKYPPIVTAMALCLAIGVRMLVMVYYSLGQNVEVLKQSIEKAAHNQPEIVGFFQLAIAILAVTVVVPFFEELLFRGLVMNELLKIMRPWAAIVIQAVFFAVAHRTLFQLFFTLVFGILLGIMYRKTKSIKYVAICHGIFNFTAFIAPGELSLTALISFLILGLALVSFSVYYIITAYKD